MFKKLKAWLGIDKGILDTLGVKNRGIKSLLGIDSASKKALDKKIKEDTEREGNQISDCQDGKAD